MTNKTEQSPLRLETGQAAAAAGRWETRQEIAVETEILIPDYLPAVFKIVKCLLEPAVMQNTIADRRWQCGGYLRCTVYYQSDEAGAKLYRTEQKYAFEKSADLPEGGILPGAALVWGETEYCNCRAVSEHRIDIRGAYILCAAADAVRTVEFVTAASGCGVQTRRRAAAGTLCTACEERTFTAQTPFPLPGEGETILDIGGSFVPGTTSVHTGQLDCGGTITMQVCSRAPGTEELTVRRKEIPVTQTLELDAAAEGDEPAVWGEVLACTLAAAQEPDGEPELSVTWKLHAELWRPVRCMAVADAYSTVCELQLTQAAFQLPSRLAAVDTAVQAAAEDDLPDAEARVLGSFVSLGAPQLSAAGKGEGVQVTGRGTAHLICADARGELACYDKAFSWALPDVWSGSIAQCVPRLHAALGRVSSSRSGAKVRVELEVRVTGQVLQNVAYTAVSAVQPGEEYPDKADGPALYLYYAQRGESVFDVARRYHARAADLAAANGLEAAEGQSLDDMTVPEICLLIPAAL